MINCDNCGKEAHHTTESSIGTIHLCDECFYNETKGAPVEDALELGGDSE